MMQIKELEDCRDPSVRAASNAVIRPPAGESRFLAVETIEYTCLECGRSTSQPFDPLVDGHLGKQLPRG
jgi:hypothetical protein